MTSQSNGTPGPDLLPPEAPRELIGRQDVLSYATAALLHPRGQYRAVLLTGQGGIGKSAVAQRLTHDLAPEFPDGSMWISLGPLGYQRPGIEYIAQLLLTRIADDSRVHSLGLDAQVQAIRRLLRERRMLIVVDDVGDEGQVAELLPPRHAESAVLLTSRRAMGGLDIHTIDLSGLPRDVAVEFLRLTADAPSTYDPRAYDQLVEFSQGSPLVLQLIGSLLRRGDTPAAVVKQLTDESARWRIAGSAKSPPLEAAFEYAYRRLDRSVAGVLELLALQTDTTWVSADDLGREAHLPRAPLRSVLTELASAGLLVAYDGRYALHPLVRRYVRQRLGSEDIGSLGADLALPHLRARDMLTLRALSMAGLPARVRDEADQVEVQEYALRVAAEAQRTADVVVALVNVAVLHYAAERRDDAVGALAAALGTAQRAGDTASVAEIKLIRARVNQSLGKTLDAQADFTDSIAALRELDDQARLTFALAGLGDTLVSVGHAWEARETYEAALARSGDARHRHVLRFTGTDETVVLTFVPQLVARLARICEYMGDLEAAGEMYQRSRDLAVKTGDEGARSEALLRLAFLSAVRGIPDRATEYLYECYRGSHRSGVESRANDAALAIGVLKIGQKSAKEAWEWFQRAVDASEGDARTSAVATFAKAVLLQGADNGREVSLLESAIALFREAGEQFGEAHALATLGARLQAVGEPESGAAADGTARAMLSKLGSPMMEPVEALFLLAFRSRPQRTADGPPAIREGPVGA